MRHDNTDKMRVETPLLPNIHPRIQHAWSFSSLRMTVTTSLLSLPVVTYSRRSLCPYPSPCHPCPWWFASSLPPPPPSVLFFFPDLLLALPDLVDCLPDLLLALPDLVDFLPDFENAWS